MANRLHALSRCLYRLFHVLHNIRFWCSTSMGQSWKGRRSRKEERCGGSNQDLKRDSTLMYRYDTVVLCSHIDKKKYTPVVYSRVQLVNSFIHTFIPSRLLNDKYRVNEALIGASTSIFCRLVGACHRLTYTTRQYIADWFYDNELCRVCCMPN